MQDSDRAKFNSPLLDFGNDLLDLSSSTTSRHS